MWSQAGLTKLTSELSKMRMQEDSRKMEVEKFKELYLKKLRSNSALFSHLPSRQREKEMLKTNPSQGLVTKAWLLVNRVPGFVDWESK